MAVQICSTNSLASSGTISTIYAGEPRSRASRTYQEKPTILPGLTIIRSTQLVMFSPTEAGCRNRADLGSDRVGYPSKSFLERIHSQTELCSRFFVLAFDLFLNATNREHCNEKVRA